MPQPHHGSDLSLAPTLGPLVRAHGLGIRDALSAVAGAGFGAVQFDAALPGIRPRELDTHARRDLAATVRRAGLATAGVDLFIPRQHLLAPETVDRATDALLAAVGFAADLGRVPLSVALPICDLADDVATAVVSAAETAGVRLAVYAEDQHDDVLAWARSLHTIAGVGMDPAAHLAANTDPIQTVQRSLDSLTVARLSDTTRGLADGSRLPAGGGDLDVMGYRASVDLAPPRRGPVVLDLRGLDDPLRAMAAGQTAWDRAGVVY